MKCHYIFCIIVIFFSWNIQAQESETADKIHNNPITPSAQPWSFSTYGSGEQKINHGTVSVNIPVYTYEDPDFEIPISISYASNGYKPNQQANSIGLGWSLNTGGYITRKIVGLRDDQKIRGINSISGFSTYWEQGPKIYRAKDIYQNAEYKSDGDLYTFNLNSGIYTETTPDQFTFNFLDHHGQFSLDGGKEVWVYNANHPNGEYRIDIEKIYTSEVYDGQKNSTIVITTGDGYTYEFRREGLLGAISVLDPSEVQPRFRNLSFPRNYWPLTKITAPNGRIVTFEYGDGDYSSDNTYERISNLQWFTNYQNPMQSGDDILYDCLMTKERTRQLRRITVDGRIRIEFNYSSRTPEVKKIIPRFSSAVIPEMSSERRLSGIKVIDLNDGSIIKKCTLNHIYGKGNPVLFLDQIIIEGEGTYRFEYYDLNTIFPNHGTVDLDHWGYYNLEEDSQPTYWGESSYEQLLKPAVTANGEPTKQSYRSPYFLAARKGMLRKVIYPTKGFSTFTYEPHKYIKKISRDNTTGYLPYLQAVSQEEIAGGIRIHRIADYTSATDSTTRTFYYNYVTTQGVKTGCSGILLHVPRYTLPNITTCGYFNVVKYPEDKYHIEYAEVMEQFSNGSFNVYHFSNYEENPDVGYDTSLVKPLYSPEEPIKYQLYIEPYSKYIDRGQLMSVRKYDAKSTLKRKEETISRTNSGWSVYTIKKAHMSAYMYEETVSNSIPKETRITEYLDNGMQYVTSHSMEYNTFMQPISDQVFCNGHKIKTYKWMYPSDHPAGTPVLLAMRRLNYISPTLQEDVYDATGNLIKSQKFLYDLYDEGMSNPHQIFLGQIQELKNQIVPVKDPEKAKYTTTAVFRYNQIGRMIESTDQNGISTCYIWGYGNLYPVAVGQNCAIAQTRTIVDSSDLLYSGLSSSQETALRKITGAEFTTYQFKPFIGVSTVTNPRGESIYYNYFKNKLHSVEKSYWNSAGQFEKSRVRAYEYSIDR